jgi:hypothetical protein
VVTPGTVSDIGQSDMIVEEGEGGSELWSIHGGAQSESEWQQQQQGGLTAAAAAVVTH